MDSDGTRILITCKTYPNPSLSHHEIVCTAGLTEDGKFIRLYPVNFRHLPQDKQYQKYDWIKARLEKRIEDPRPESYRPDVSSMEIVQHLGSENNWEARKQIVLSAKIQTMCDLQNKSQSEQSLGIVRAREIISFSARMAAREWRLDHQNLLRQTNLFGKKSNPLEKIPYSFYVRYYCDHPECRSHEQSIIDWETSALFLNVRSQYGDEKRAIDAVRDKYINDILSENRDTLLFVGTVLRHSSWLVIGTFHPKRERQMRLFR